MLPATRASLVATSISRPNSREDRKSTRLNSSHSQISYAVFCLKKKNTKPFTHAHGGAALATGSRRSTRRVAATTRPPTTAILEGHRSHLAQAFIARPYLRRPSE